MKPITFPCISLVLALAASLAPAVADTIKLKNGTIYEGTITADTADAYDIEIPMGNIKEFKHIIKSEVAEMKKTPPDEKDAIELLKKLQNTPDGMSAADYEKAIKSQIQPWLDKYKASKKKPEIEALLKHYQDELAKVKAGDLKLRGAWVSAAEIKWNEYNVNARKLRARMEESLKARKPMQAYSAFAELELNYPASVESPPSIEAMKKAMPSLEGVISRAIEENPAKVKERKTLLGQLPADKKKETDEQIKKEEADIRKQMAKEKKDKVGVPSFYAYDLKSIQDSLAGVKKEVTRLAALDVPALTTANKKFEQGLKDMNEKAYLSAKGNFEAAAKVHSKDVTVKKKLDEATKAIEAAKKKPAGVK